MPNTVEAQGKRAVVSYDGAYVTITSQAANGSAKGQTRISAAHISAVLWRPAGAVVSGFIQFVVAGATSDGYAVSFNRSQQAAMQNLMRSVQETVAARAGGRLTA